MVEWTDAQCERVAVELVRRGLGPLAIAVLEAGRPLSFVGSQFLTFLHPIVRLVAEPPGWASLIGLLEDRQRIETLIVALERAEESV